MITIIAAVAKNGVIGKDGTLPWKLSEDMKHFKRLTTGHAVIMGRKTWDSIGRPLPNRLNVVVSRQGPWQLGLPTEVRVVDSIEAALAHCNEEDSPFIIGGAQIYAAGLLFAQRMVLTEIDRDVEGDTFFPKFDRGEWKEVSRVPGEAADVQYVTLERSIS